MIETIGLSENLSEKIVDIILKKSEEDVLKAAKMQVILPTKRTCLSVKKAFLQRSREKAILLPNLVALYELNKLDPDVPPEIDRLERMLLLTKLCQKKPNITTPEQAFKVGVSLGELLDTFYQFEIDTSRLNELVQDPVFAEHWNDTVVFLDVLTKSWPLILNERNCIDSADRQIRLIDSFNRQLQQDTDTLVIAAGLDGGLPAVRRLLNTINKRENGLVLLEGVDTQLTDSDFKNTPPHHYQANHIQILKALNTSPSQVRQITPMTPAEEMMKIVFMPENKTEEWMNGKINPQSLKHVKRIDAETIYEEALTIALLLRETLETPEKTAVLVTPDRDLARRVIVEMKRWGIILDDSAGTPVPQTELGIYLRLIAQVACHPENVSDWLALLKNPLSADHINPTTLRQIVKSTEKEARRQQKKFVPPITTDFTPLFNLFQSHVKTPFTELLKIHIQIAETLATSHDRAGSERLWSNETGKITFEFLTYLLDKADLIEDIEPVFYPKIMEILLGTLTVRPLYGMHPRLDILGPIEARFHHADRCIIGGLNEGTFPGIPETGPWLNRPMRQCLGLPPPENKIAALSMDFAHCFCGPEVILTRSLKSGGAETIPSRFLSRLDAALEGSNLNMKIQTSNWAKELDTPDWKDTVERPAPCPPVEARPKSLSVTKIENWMRNPYSIYAQYILGLKPLDSLSADKKQQQYGIAIHKALELFVTENPNNTNLERLLELGEQALTKEGFTETEKIFYLPRFNEMAKFIIQQQQETKNEIKNSFPEKQGSFTFEVDGNFFTLTGQADRIDHFKNGSARIVDYKTGSVPSIQDVEKGFSPQLPLEGLLLNKNGFECLSSPEELELDYWKLASKTKNCKVTPVKSKEKNVNSIIQESFEGLQNLIRTFNKPETPYEVNPISGKEQTYNNYEHLSRTAEWQNDDGESE